MSEEQSMQVVKFTIDPVEESKKVEAWGKFGSQLYRAGVRLQLQTQEIVNQLIDPTSSDLITQAEQALAAVKKDYHALQQSRIAVTSKFDPVVARLMESEKSLLKSIGINQDAIVKAKQKLKEEAKTEVAKAKELKDIAAQVRVYVADMHAASLNAQLALLSKAYDHALATSLSAESLPEFIQKLCARVNINNSITPLPKPKFQYNTEEDINKVVAENFNPWPAQKYADGFALDVTNKFSDWEQALQNKEAAKKLNDDAVAETTAAIDDQKTKQTTAARLEALAIPLTEGTDSKPLKEVWQIAEPQNTDEMFCIINAFAVNRDLVEPQLGGRTNPANIGIKQMIAALVAVKKADENFECTGITFSKTEKL